ncbi:MAG: glycosyltransferase [Clostridiales bacterium]|nr:glycosyltransferase [Clostridiales bacterium]
MRIVHVASDRGIGGTARYLKEVLSSPAFGEDQLAVVVPPGTLADHLAAALPHVQVWVRPMPSRSFHPSALLDLLRLFRAWRPHVVHTHSSLSGRLAASLAGVPAVFYTRHGLKDRTSAQVKGFSLSIARSLERRLPHQVVAVSQKVAKELAEEGIPEARIHVLYAPMDPGPFQALGERREGVRSSLGIAPEEVVVLGTGRLVAEKRWEAWLDAVAEARDLLERQKGPRLRPLIAGDGPLKGRLEKRAASLDLDPSLFLGFHPDPLALYAAADIFLLLSLREAFSLAVVEAQMAGLPVVVAAESGSGEIIADGETGRLVPAGSAAQAREILVDLALHGEKRLRMGQWARVDAQRRHDPLQQGRKLRELYLKALSPGESP